MVRKPVQFNLCLERRRLSYRRKFKYIIGIDEAGRGPLAGPVVAACAGLRTNIEGISDSKKIASQQREKMFVKIKENAFFSFGLVGEKIIDKLNIYQATVLAFRKAIERLFFRYPLLKTQEVFFIIDGSFVDLGTEVNYICLPRADAIVQTVAAASILAKVLRDRIMCSYGHIFPLWNFAQHKGYPTSQHRRIIKEYGLSPIHRLSFRNSYESS